MAELLDLDAEVLTEYFATLADWLAPHTGAVHRIADLGAGTGTGTTLLATVCPRAMVVAVDSSPDMLARLRIRAGDRGVTDRVETVVADLDEPWPELGSPDLVWMANSLHHCADPDRVMAQVRAALRPGGLFVVTEMAEPMRYLRDDAPAQAPGLEGRVLAAVGHRARREVPELGADFGPRFTAAGFDLLDERHFTITATPSAPQGRYAQIALSRYREWLDGSLAPDDLRVLDDLLGDGPEALAHRDDLEVRGGRTGWLLRRP